MSDQQFFRSALDESGYRALNREDPPLRLGNRIFFLAQKRVGGRTLLCFVTLWRGIFLLSEYFDFAP